MTETIISSLISGCVAILVCVITQAAANRKTTALFEYQLQELTKKVEKHNNLIERTYKLEERTEVQETRISALEKSKGG